MRAVYWAGALLCALALATAASGAGTSTPGVSPTEIVIGGTIPLTGVASSFRSVGLGASYYFKYVNAHGGVNHRKIRYIIKDDQYDPAQTMNQTRGLVEQDHVFAIFNPLGTEQNLATRPYLNAVGVPQLFVGSGGRTFGADYKQYKWTIGYQPNYLAEGTIYGREVAKTTPKARIAALYQNDDYGNDLLAGLKHGLGKRATQIVSKQSYNADDPEVRSQIARLKSSKANTLMIFATPQFAIQAYRFAYQLGWKPKVYINVVASASNVMNLAVLASSKKEVMGSISIVFLKDPSDPRWAKDPGIKLYRAIMKRYKDPGTNVKDVYNVYGMSVAHTFVQALKKAGKNPTRASIMNAATHLTIKNDPFLLPGVVVRTTASDRFPLDQARLERWHNGHWASFGGLFRVR
jgi:branched-chain amino acid transport system substrate-binding protein